MAIRREIARLTLLARLKLRSREVLVALALTLILIATVVGTLSAPGASNLAAKGPLAAGTAISSQ